MEWPDGAQVPDYFSRGMSFDALLAAYKAFVRRNGEVDFQGDARMKGQKVTLKPQRSGPTMTVNRSAKAGGILKPNKNAVNKTVAVSKLYGSRRNKGYTLSVKNLPFSTTDSEFKNHFSHLGTILQATIDRDQNSRSRGSGTIKFKTKEEADVVLGTMQNSSIGNREIRVLLAE